jgi:uncharacterized membrane protein
VAKVKTLERTAYRTPKRPDTGGSGRRRTPWWWWLGVVLAVGIAGYALSFLARGQSAFPPNLRESFSARPWGIYPHVLIGSIALLLGPLQFRRDLLLHNRPLHRRIGVVYVACAALTGVVGTYMSVYSLGGMVTHLGFGVLGVLTVATTVCAYVRIRGYDVSAHREWMIRSYALIFGAVTLRAELPLLIIGFQGDFAPAYAIVSWLAWVPNILLAEWYLRRTRGTPAAVVPKHSRDF